MGTESKNVGYVLMLDMSASMQNVLEQVCINSKAFVGYSFAGDQFAVCQFSDDAGWVYPKGGTPGLATVSEGAAPEIEEACREIDLLKIRGGTNIGAAIELGNRVIPKSTAAFNAFVLLSDGNNNVGPKPETVLGLTPPIYIAGLGPELKPDYFNPLICKNELSRYHGCPHYADMMLLFNEIRGMIPGVQLLVNQREEWNGRGELRVQFRISAAGGQVRVSVVWPRRQYRYTAFQAVGSDIHVHLENPLGQVVKTAPRLDQGGLCIFDVEGAQEGTWNICCEYDLAEACDCTFGVFYKA